MTIQIARFAVRKFALRGTHINNGSRGFCSYCCLRRVSFTLLPQCTSSAALHSSAHATLATRARFFVTPKDEEGAGSSARSTTTTTTTTVNDDYVFDPALSVQEDVAINTAKKTLDGFLRDILPANATESVKEKVRRQMQQHPIDALITQQKVQITHIEEPDTGVEKKMSLSPCDLAEALQHAKEREMNLVQMGSRGDVAYCRIRREIPRILALVSAELEEISARENQGRSAARRGGERGEGKMRELIDHQFRDVADAHFVGWKSKKIVEDIRKGHPVKLTIKEFQFPSAAISKLREMCQAMQQYAEKEVIYHHFTSIVANDREASVTFAPSFPSAKSSSWKHIKYPGEKEWAHASKRMEEACQKSGRYGTYMKSNALKPRSLGQTPFRVDKYGRRID